MNTISKSQYIKGIQCPKALWLYRNRKDLAQEVSEGRQFIFDTGHEVGELAQKYFGEGIEITEPYYKINQAIQSTNQAVGQGKALIFEATASSKTKTTTSTTWHCSGTHFQVPATGLENPF